MYSYAEGEGRVRFFDSATDMATDADGAPGYVDAGTFTQDARRFAGARGDRMWVWDPATGALLADNRAHRPAYSAFDIAYTADGSRIVVTDTTGSLHRRAS